MHYCNLLICCKNTSKSYIYLTSSFKWENPFCWGTNLINDFYTFHNSLFVLIIAGLSLKLQSVSMIHIETKAPWLLLLNWYGKWNNKDNHIHQLEQINYAFTILFILDINQVNRSVFAWFTAFFHTVRCSFYYCLSLHL